MTGRAGSGGLRTTLLVIGGVGLALIGAVFLAGMVLPGLLVLGVWLALMVVGLAIERWRYKPALGTAPTAPGWAATPERFVDPETGRAMTVWMKAGTGERAYVEDGASPSPPSA